MKTGSPIFVKDILGTLSVRGYTKWTSDKPNFAMSHMFVGWNSIMKTAFRDDSRIKALKRFANAVFDEGFKTALRESGRAFVFDMEPLTPEKIKVRPEDAAVANDVRDYTEIDARGKTASEIFSAIKEMHERLKTADGKQRTILETTIKQKERELENIMRFFRDHGFPTREEYTKNPKYWTQKIRGTINAPSTNSNSEILEGNLAEKNGEAIGALELKAFVSTEDNSKMMINQIWIGWEHERVLPYMNDQKMQAIKRLYDEIGPKNQVRF